MVELNIERSTNKYVANIKDKIHVISIGPRQLNFLFLSTHVIYFQHKVVDVSKNLLYVFVSVQINNMYLCYHCIKNSSDL